MSYRVVRSDSYLEHHGILGQKWGKQNGPPYPLGSGDHSASERKAGWRKSLNKETIKTGLKYAGIGLAAYGVYKLAQSGNLDKIVDLGHNKVKELVQSEFMKQTLESVRNTKAGAVEQGRKAVESVMKEKTTDIPNSGSIKRLAKPEATATSLSKANPLKGTIEGRNNCVPSAIAGFMREEGFDVAAKSTNGKMLNTAGVVEECFKDVKVYEGSAVKFGRSKQDASEMLVKRYGNNAKGLCAVDLKRPDGSTGGHCFSWKILNGDVSFMDYNTGREDASGYFRFIDRNGQLVLARLDGLEKNLDNISKYC